MTDDDAALLAFVRAEGQWSWLMPGIRTHPDGDENQRRIYEACERLEREGALKRRDIGGDRVVFFEPFDR